MPKIIDHEQRRTEIAEAVLRVVARDGVNGVTVRRVAEEAGWSTGILHHYFTDKQALLVGGLRLAARVTGQNMKRALRMSDSRARLRLLIEAGIPLDEKRESLCRIFFFFWAEGVCDPDLSAELARYYDWWQQRLAETIEAGQNEGWIRADTSVPMLAEMLVAMADGIAVRARFSSPPISKRQLRNHVKMWIDNLAPGTA